MKRARAAAALLPALLAAAALAAGCGFLDRPAVRVLFDFEKESDLDHVWWSCPDLYSLTTEHASSGERALRCDLGTGDYPGVRFRDLHSDWTGYDRLAFTIRQGSADTLTLVVRIDDADSGEDFHNRYNGRFPLPPGASEILVPLEEVRRAPKDRQLDLSRVERLVLFLYRPGRPPVLWIDHLRLEREEE